MSGSNMCSWITPLVSVCHCAVSGLVQKWEDVRAGEFRLSPAAGERQSGERTKEHIRRSLQPRWGKDVESHPSYFKLTESFIISREKISNFIQRKWVFEALIDQCYSIYSAFMWMFVFLSMYLLNNKKDFYLYYLAQILAKRPINGRK